MSVSTKHGNESVEESVSALVANHFHFKAHSWDYEYMVWAGWTETKEDRRSHSLPGKSSQSQNMYRFHKNMANPWPTKHSKQQLPVLIIAEPDEKISWFEHGNWWRSRAQCRLLSEHGIYFPPLRKISSPVYF